MTTALIGYTGFVGGILSCHTRFDDLYRSTNIEDIRGKSYELIVSAGVSSLKWKANQEPQADRQAILKLMDALRQVKARTFVLISTIDVYDNPVGVDEGSPIAPNRLMPYGRNRWELEQFVRERFASMIIRLPNLFGPGLKKNIIYDLLHDHNVNQIHSGTVLQWYSTENLWADLQRARQHRLALLNIATEPWPTMELARDMFGKSLPASPQPAPHYDFRTRHSGLWGKSGPYLYSKNEVSHELIRFVEQERSKSIVR